LAGKIAFPVPAPLFATILRTARRLGGAELPPEAVAWLRNGLTVDCTRLIEEVGFRPRSTLEVVRDFIEKLLGRRVFPSVVEFATGRGRVTPADEGAFEPLSEAGTPRRRHAS
jgi:hypothetical protein